MDVDMNRMMPHKPTPDTDRDERLGAAVPPDEDREEETLLADAETADDDDLADDIDAVSDEDTALEEAEGFGAASEAEAPPEDDFAGGPDDALGLYLRQMGAIPLLNKEKELALARKLEHHRNRFRSAALLCPRVLARVLEKFEQIAAGQTPIDPNVDVYSSEELKLTRAQILSRLKKNLATLATLLDQESKVFVAGVRDEFPEIGRAHV